jgi:hypothetical protein
MLREAVSKCARDINWQIQRAFEEMGCTCHPLRKEKERLDAECRRLELELNNSETFQRRDEVRQEVQEIDRREHPGLDSQAQVASPFFRLWLFERLSSEDAPDLSSSQKLAASYAEAWLVGWRPKGG